MASTSTFTSLVVGLACHRQNTFHLRFEMSRRNLRRSFVPASFADTTVGTTKPAAGSTRPSLGIAAATDDPSIRHLGSQSNC